MFILVCVLTVPSSILFMWQRNQQTAAQRQQLVTSRGREAPIPPSLQHIWSLRKRIRSKISLPRCNILATRSMYFRVQFHGKFRLSLQGCWEGHPALMTVSQPASHNHWCDFEFTFFKLFAYCSGFTFQPWQDWSGLAAPDPPGCCLRPPAMSRTSTRAFPRWGTDLFVPPLLTELVGSYLSLKYYPCVTTGSYSLYVWQLLSQIRSRHAGKHYHPICLIFLNEISVDSSVKIAVFLNCKSCYH